MTLGQQQHPVQPPQSQPSGSAAPVMLPEGLDLSNLGALAAMLGVGTVSAPPAASVPGASSALEQLIQQMQALPRKFRSQRGSDTRCLRFTGM